MSSTSGKKDAAAIIAAASRHKNPPPQPPKTDAGKKVWCDTQWTNLSMQAKKLELPTLPYFDPDTMLLSKEINHKLWNQVVRSPFSLLTFLGKRLMRAPYRRDSTISWATRGPRSRRPSWSR